MISTWSCVQRASIKLIVPLLCSQSCLFPLCHFMRLWNPPTCLIRDHFRRLCSNNRLWCIWINNPCSERRERLASVHSRESLVAVVPHVCPGLLPSVSVGSSQPSGLSQISALSVRKHAVTYSDAQYQQWEGSESTDYVSRWITDLSRQIPAYGHLVDPDLWQLFALK